MSLTNFTVARRLTRFGFLVLALATVGAISPIIITTAQKPDIEDPSETEVILSGNISGRVFQDFNGNGAYDTSGGTTAAPTAIDIGVGGVTVSLYDTAGALRGTVATTAITGIYTITSTGTGPYRIEFTAIPAGYSPSAMSTDSVLGGTATNAGSTVQFVNDGATPNVNLALNRAQDYCENNPLLCSQVYGIGDTGNPYSVFTAPYTSGSTRVTGGLPVTDFQTGIDGIASSDEVGTTFGIAYHRQSKRVFVSAYMKKHAKFGPGGTGAIYQINQNTGTVSQYVNLNTVFGANTAGANPHNTSNYNTDNGNATWDAVGKIAFGGMAISDDQTNLFVMNLADRKLYRIPTSGPLSAGTIQSVALPATMPSCTNASDVRPFAVNYYAGLVYVGAVCSADVSDDRNVLRGYIYTVNPATLAISALPVLQIPLNYTRIETDPGLSANWLAWRTNYTTISAAHFIYPQPMLTDIEFDRGNMIISLRDRDGDQTGYNNASNPNDSSQLFKGITAGDILRACGGPPSWTLESNGRCANIGGAPQNTGEGIGNGEYYYQDNYHPNGNPHDEVGIGATMQIPGHDEMVATIFDPVYIPTDNIYDSGGFRWFNNSTGAQNRGFLAYNTSDFGKANGVGNVQALCESAPIEIGNRVWADYNHNGVQDPSEPGMSGVTVHLYQGSTLVGTAVTDANGEYYFVSSTSVDPNPSDNIGQVNGGILLSTAYQVRFDLPADYLNGGQIFGSILTVANQTSQLGDDDSSDSDAVNVTNPSGSPAGTFPVITLTTGTAGQNNHTFDVGFYFAPSAAGVSIEGRIQTSDGYGIRNVRIYVTEEDGTLHTALTGAFGYYYFDNIPAGQTIIMAVASKRYTFNPTVRLISLQDNVAGLNWTSIE